MLSEKIVQCCFCQCRGRRTYHRDPITRTQSRLKKFPPGFAGTDFLNLKAWVPPRRAGGPAQLVMNFTGTVRGSVALAHSVKLNRDRRRSLHQSLWSVIMIRADRATGGPAGHSHGSGPIMITGIMLPLPGLGLPLRMPGFKLLRDGDVKQVFLSSLFGGDCSFKFWSQVDRITGITVPHHGACIRACFRGR
jgi:hypothetical protein